jgi:hypothetical protein
MILLTLFKNWPRGPHNIQSYRFYAILQTIHPNPRPCVTFSNIAYSYCEELLAPLPTLNMEDHHLSVVRASLFGMLDSFVSRPKVTPCHGDKCPICTIIFYPMSKIFHPSGTGPLKMSGRMLKKRLLQHLWVDTLCEWSYSIWRWSRAPLCACVEPCSVSET